MIVTTTYNVDGYVVSEHKGIVRGLIVRSPTIKQGFFAYFKTIFGGNIGAYTEMCEHARQQAYDLMVKHGEEIGADAILGMSYDATEVVSRYSATEVICYGTAVTLKKLQ